jgi:hypothetical protein
MPTLNDILDKRLKKALFCYVVLLQAGFSPSVWDHLSMRVPVRQPPENLKSNPNLLFL